MLMAMCLFFLYLRNIGDRRAVQLYSEADDKNCQAENTKHD